MDFTNFDTSSVLEKKGFEKLKAGQYVMRLVGFSRTKTRAGDDALVFKLQALKGLTPEASQSGDCIWFVNLTERGAGFVREAVLAVKPDGFSGNLMSDDEVKAMFLGCVIVARVTVEIKNGKSYPTVAKVAAYAGGDFVAEPSDQYWNSPALYGSGGSPPPKKNQDKSDDFFNQSSESSGSVF